jgi:hypothetical protein
MAIDGKQLRNSSVTTAKLAFTPVEDGDLAWRVPVDVLQLVGNLGEAAIEGLTPTAGDAYVVSAVDGDGTLNPGGVTSLAVGDVVEYSGSAWVRIAAGSGGFVASGVRAVLATQTALVSPYTDASDDGKIVDFDGTSLTGVASGEAVDGNAVLVNGDGGLYENQGFVFDGAVPTGTWETFGGGALTAGDGIDINANVVSTDLLASGGLKIVSTELAVEPNDFAGTGLEDDGSDNLRLAAQGNGIAGGAGSTLSVQADGTTGGNIQPVNVVANGVGLDVAAIAGTGIAADGSANLQVDTASTVTFSGATWTFPTDELQVTGTPNTANDAVNKSYVDNVASGLQWREPADALQLVGNLGEVALEGLSPTAGDAYVVSAVDGDGTLNPGGVGSLALGDLVEYDGANWVRLVAGSGGFVASGVRAVLATQTALVSPYTDASDDGKLYEFDGTSLTGADTGEATDGSAVLISADGGYYENAAYVFDGTVPTGSWIQFTGGGGLTAGDGIDIVTNVVSVDLLASGGLKIVSTELGVEPADFAGTGLEDDGSDNLRLATQGNGIAGGAGSTLSVLAANDTVGVTGSGVTAAQPAKGNKSMTALVTTTDNDQATATAVAAAPATDSWVGLAVNGVLEEVGDGTKAGVAAYISGDSGTNARAWNDVVATDTIHWNGSVAGYELAATDVLDLIFNDAE